jgi:hypothetical protein
VGSLLLFLGDVYCLITAFVYHPCGSCEVGLYWLWDMSMMRVFQLVLGDSLLLRRTVLLIKTVWVLVPNIIGIENWVLGPVFKNK